MENSNKNNSKSFWIIVGIIILVAIFYFAGKSNNIQTQSEINNKADKSEACAKSSKDLYDSLVNKYISQNTVGNMSYQNHFNATLGKCFMLEKWTGVGLNLGTTEYRIYDVYDNTQLAESNSWSAIDKYSCSIGAVGNPCERQQFSDFVNTRMEGNSSY